MGEVMYGIGDRENIGRTRSAQMVVAGENGYKEYRLPRHDGHKALWTTTKKKRPHQE